MNTRQPVADWHVNLSYGNLATAHLGRLPLIINPDDEAPPELQLEPFWTRYKSGWSLTQDNTLYSSTYLPAMPAAYTDIGNRIIFSYPHNMVVILDPSGNFIAGKLHD